MRTLTSRFVFGAFVMGTLCLMAEPAEAGRLRRRGGARGGNDCCCQQSYGYGGGYAQAGYAATPCCGSGGAVAYGQGGMMYAQGGMMYSQGGMAYQPGYSYQPGYYGGPIQGAGGYMQPGTIIPAGGFPAPMPAPGTGTGTGTTGDATPAKSEKVSMTDGKFEPATLNITAGTTVRWSNDDKVPHTVTSDKGTWGSNEIPPGGDFTATFTQPGTFTYHCKLHKDMKGTIVVK